MIRMYELVSRSTLYGILIDSEWPLTAHFGAASNTNSMEEMKKLVYYENTEPSPRYMHDFVHA